MPSLVGVFVGVMGVRRTSHPIGNLASASNAAPITATHRPHRLPFTAVSVLKDPEKDGADFEQEMDFSALPDLSSQFAFPEIKIERTTTIQRKTKRMLKRGNEKLQSLASSINNQTTAAAASTFPFLFRTMPKEFWSWRGGDNKKGSAAEANTAIQSPASSVALENNDFKDTSASATVIPHQIETKSLSGSHSSSAPYTVSAASAQGYRSYMEDEHFLSHDGDFAAVFDGHGGPSVSRYLRKNLYANVQGVLPQLQPSTATTTVGLDGDDAGEMTTPIEEDIVEGKNEDASSFVTNGSVSKGPSAQDYENAIRFALEKVDREVQRISHWSYQGSTAVAIWIHEEKQLTSPIDEDTPLTALQPNVQRTIIAANVGDSRAVLCRNGTAWALTRDHKPNDPTEQSRIESLGGEVVWCGERDAQGQPILERGIYRVNGNLALSRAIGDRSERPHVTAESEILSVPILEDEDDFIILATDGLWDVFESDAAVSFVQALLIEGHHHSQIAGLVVAEALRRGTYDNVSVVILWLR